MIVTVLFLKKIMIICSGVAARMAARLAEPMKILKISPKPMCKIFTTATMRPIIPQLTFSFYNIQFVLYRSGRLCLPFLHMMPAAQ